MDRKEAIEIIIKNYPHVSNSGSQFESALRELIPELKESEDERIMKEIIQLLRDASNGKTRAISSENLVKWTEFLEKQKENPKSADSIPSDCTSDAKCEDRWHKVGDFLPNDAREVLCKDAIGNFFIGRYYKCSNSWEVSMYDDVEKTNEDNPPVVMWTDIPSEKQKEQKPAEWSEEDENYLEEIIDDLKFCKKNRRSCKNGLIEDCIDWLNNRLKSLRPQPHWRPTKRQIDALNSIILIGSFTYVGQTQDLIALKDELKELM